MLFRPTIPPTTQPTLFYHSSSCDIIMNKTNCVWVSCLVKIPTSQSLSSVANSLRAKEMEEGEGERREFPLSSLPSCFPPFLFTQRKMYKTPTEMLATQAMWEINSRLLFLLRGVDRENKHGAITQKHYISFCVPRKVASGISDSLNTIFISQVSLPL